MTTIRQPSISVGEEISFSLKDNKIIIQEMDGEKMSPFWCEISMDDWLEIVKFINTENDRKSS